MLGSCPSQEKGQHCFVFSWKGTGKGPGRILWGWEHVSLGGRAGRAGLAFPPWISQQGAGSPHQAGGCAQRLENDGPGEDARTSAATRSRWDDSESACQQWTGSLGLVRSVLLPSSRGKGLLLGHTVNALARTGSRHAWLGDLPAMPRTQRDFTPGVHVCIGRNQV